MFFGLVVLDDKSLEFKQMLCAIFNLLTTEFAFNERVSTIAEVQNHICFQAVTIVIITDVRINIGGVGFEIADARVDGH